MEEGFFKSVSGTSKPLLGLFQKKAGRVSVVSEASVSDQIKSPNDQIKQMCKTGVLA